MSKLLEQVGRSVAARKLISRGQRLLVAVSGGVDSMVLLQLLHALAPEHGWRLTVGHFNHQLRGRSSEADERLVRETAAELGWPFVSGRADVRRFARTKKVSVEMAARQLRHEFFARVARRQKITAVALAHHADDQVELFFLRALRGCGGEGLAGMKWNGASPVDSTVKLVRPLLDVSRAALEAFARERKIRFREDASNALLDIQRNRIRHELLPLLRKHYQPALKETIVRAMEIVGAESEFVNQVARDWLVAKKRTAFVALPVAVQRRITQQQLVEQGVAPDFYLIEQLRSEVGRVVTISPHLRVWRDGKGLLRLGEPLAPKRCSPAGQLKIDLRKSGATFFAGAYFSWRIIQQKTFAQPVPISGQEFFDADKVGPQVTLRHWRAGDRFQPSGMKSSVKLQDLFVNAKIPRAQRMELVVATTAEGELFWVEGLRIAERFKLSATTVRRLKWLWQRPQSGARA